MAACPSRHVPTDMAAVSANLNSMSGWPDGPRTALYLPCLSKWDVQLWDVQLFGFEVLLT
jgi:hypothetical protein